MPAPAPGAAHESRNGCRHHHARRKANNPSTVTPLGLAFAIIGLRRSGRSLEMLAGVAEAFFQIRSLRPA
ncbi:hypothetical protein ABZ912_17985 [Nonomuraea angiospora]|uniref:hypothetical protein n=1 Tax=Nonomuraea angiospora TaxID=46172 RepID=UPI0033E51A51